MALDRISIYKYIIKAMTNCYRNTIPSNVLMLGSQLNFSTSISEANALVEVSSVLVRQKHFMTGRRSREDSRKASKLSKGGGALE